jgi:hypothetical protein
MDAIHALSLYNVKVTFRSTVSRPVSLRVKPLLGPGTRFLLLSAAVLWTWGALSDERTGLSLSLVFINPVRTSQETLRLRYKAQPVNAV